MRTYLAAALIALAGCAGSTASPTPEVVAAAPIAAPSGEYALDPAHTSLLARVSHFGLSNYTLRFTQVDATLVFSAENPASSRLTASARAASLSTDMPMGDRISAVLASADWLDSANHPEIRFESQSIERTGPATGRIIGALTLRGVTRPLTLEVTFNQAYARHPFGRPLSQLGFSARGVIHRSEFGVSTFMATDQSPGVGDEIELIIEAEFVRAIAG